MRRGTVLISGASVAGPALAYWLRRYGFEPTVVERAPALREGGQAVDLRGAARAVVERMGLMPAVRAAHTGARGMVHVDAAGRRVVAMPADALGDSGGMIADLEILRGDLSRILHDATSDVEYVFGDSVTALVERPDGVEARFERSAPRTFDVVVGADGVRSTVRRLAFGPEARYVTDQGYSLAVFGMHTEVDLDGWHHLHAMPGRLAGLYPLPDGAARAMFFFRSPVDAHDGRDVRDLVAETFAGGGWQVPRMLECMRTADDLYFDRASKVSVGGWSRGRAVLLGDSAFGGSVGMGTSMAVVGAYVLAGELAAADGDHVAAFAGYEGVLRDYVTANRKPMPGGLRAFLPPTRLEIRFWQQLMKMMLRLPWKDRFAGDIQRTANAVELRDYAAIARSTPGVASRGTTRPRA